MGAEALEALVVSIPLVDSKENQQEPLILNIPFNFLWKNSLKELKKLWSFLAKSYALNVLGLGASPCFIIQLMVDKISEARCSNQVQHM